MTFEDAISKAVSEAHRTDNVIYVYKGDNVYPWAFSLNYKHGWLFKAFPSGCGILSREGRNILGRGLNE